MSVVAVMALVVSGLVWPGAAPESASATETKAAADPVLPPSLPAAPLPSSGPQEPTGDYVYPKATVPLAPAPTPTATPPVTDDADDITGMTVSRQSEFATEYSGANGEKAMRLSTDPVAVQQDDGKWVDVDPSLKNEGDGWGVQAHPLDPTFADKASDDAAVTLRRDGHEVSFSLQGAKAGNLESPFWFWDDWNELAYRNVASNTDLEYNLTDSAVQESVVLNKLPGEKHTWAWDLNPGDLTPRLTDDDVLELVDGDGVAVMWSPTPVAWDSSQTDPSMPREQTTLEASLVRTADDGWVYKVTVDEDWLQSPDRVFPVTIDPEITVSPVNQNSYKSNGATYAGQVHVGNTAEVSNGYWWRAVENFAGGAAVGKFIEGGNLGIYYLNGSTASFSGSVRVATGWCYTCQGTVLANYTLGSGATNVSATAFQQYIADQFGFGGTTNVAFILNGTENSAYTYKQIQSDLWIKYHNQVTPSQVTGTGASPTNGATGVSLTPTFKSVASAAATGSSLAYSFRIGLDANFSQMVYTSPESTSSTLTVPEGTLKPGTKYYWRAYVRDAGWDGFLGQSTLFSTGAWSFTTNQVPYPAATVTATPGTAAPSYTPQTITTLAPQLSVSGLPLTDTDTSTAMKYQFTVATAQDAETGTIVTSPNIAPDSAGTATWTVPAGTLEDGGVYTWTVAAYDGKDLYNPTPKTITRTFKVDLRLGASGPSPFDTEGPVTVNLANGNANVSFASPTVNTLGGPIGMSFSYNSQEAKNGNRGLRVEYFDARTNPTDPAPTTAAGYAFGSKTPILARTDSSINFNWGTESPADAVPDDGFMARWSGYVTLPASLANTDVRFGVRRDDGARLYIDDTLTLDKWTLTPAVTEFEAGHAANAYYDGSAHKIRFEYFERYGAAVASLWYKVGDNGVEKVVPPDWFTKSVQILPVGWRSSAPIQGAASAWVSAQVTTSAIVLSHWIRQRSRSARTRPMTK